MHTGHGTPDFIDVCYDCKIPVKVWVGIIGDKNNLFKQIFKYIVDVTENRFPANPSNRLVFAGEAVAESAGQNDAGTLSGHIQNNTGTILWCKAKNRPGHCQTLNLARQIRIRCGEAAPTIDDLY